MDLAMNTLNQSSLVNLERISEKLELTPKYMDLPQITIWFYLSHMLDVTMHTLLMGPAINILQASTESHAKILVRQE
jgi:hypothetical protein